MSAKAAENREKQLLSEQALEQANEAPKEMTPDTRQTDRSAFPNTMGRRDTLKALGLAGAAAACGVDPHPPSTGPAIGPATSPAGASEPSSSESHARPENRAMPTVFLPHGGGPWPFMDLDRMGMAGAYDGLEGYLRRLRSVPPTRPSAVLLISAHWEETRPTLMSAARPPMLYDYGGFPPETYQVQWPAPGAPAIAERTQDLLASANIPSDIDRTRGFDHGTFVPLAITYPQADVPTFQLSLKRGLDPRTHLAIGRALAPLREEGVFIVGSGMSYHNLRALMRRAPSIADDAAAFDDWLGETCVLDADGRDTRLSEWEHAPRARACHPREEHLLPLMVVAGAAGESTGSIPYRDTLMGARVSAVHFGV